MKDERTLNPVSDNINQVLSSAWFRYRRFCMFKVLPSLVIVVMVSCIWVCGLYPTYDTGVARFLRDVHPAHYSVKIESFSRLAHSGERYVSSKFDAGCYTWRLILYPNGNTKRGGRGHISLYLAIEKTDSLPLGWEAYVTYKMFVFDHNKDKYLTIQDDPAVQQIRRFHQAKKESGFDRLISLETFNAATNGYLLYDSCVFGVEVYTVKSTGNGETVKILEDPIEFTLNWKIFEFSKFCKEMLNDDKLESEVFTAGGNMLRLLLYPNGDSGTKDHLSLFLELVESPASLNQLSDCHHKRRGKESWFKISTRKLNGKGWPEFMLLSDLRSESSGFIVNDTLLVQAKVKIKTEVTNLAYN